MHIAHFGWWEEPHACGLRRVVFYLQSSISFISPPWVQWPDLMCATFQPLSHPTKNLQVPWISDTLSHLLFNFRHGLPTSKYPLSTRFGLFHFLFLSFLIRWGGDCEDAAQAIQHYYFGISKNVLPNFSCFWHFKTWIQPVSLSKRVSTEVLAVYLNDVSDWGSLPSPTNRLHHILSSGDESVCTASLTNVSSSLDEPARREKPLVSPPPSTT